MSKIFIYAFIVGSFCVESAFSAQPEKIQENPKIVVEPDQTDIFAIPLDEDAQDQQDELYNLEHPKK